MGMGKLAMRLLGGGTGRIGWSWGTMGWRKLRLCFACFDVVVILIIIRSHLYVMQFNYNQQQYKKHVKNNNKTPKKMQTKISSTHPNPHLHPNPNPTITSSQSPTQQSTSTTSTSPTFIIKLHLNKYQQVQICLTANSNVDVVIKECIEKYRLRKDAHQYLRKRIVRFMEGVVGARRGLKGSGDNGANGDSCGGKSHDVLAVKESFYKDIKAGDIDKNKVSVQKTPKMKENSFFKKQNSFKFPKSSEKNPKIYLKKKTQSEKQNIQILLAPKLQRPARDLSLKPRSARKSEPINKSAQKCKKQLQTEQIAGQYFGSIEDDQLFSPCTQLRMKTDSSMDLSTRMKQFSLQDLQKQMNEQMTDLKYQKKLQKLQPELCNLFRSIIRYNPPKISKIDPRYACFEDLSQQMIKALHQFLINLKDQELNSLDFQNFKKLLIKYRRDNLLDCLR